MLSTRQVRLLLATLSGALVTWFALRRRETLSQRVPELVEERIVLPIGVRLRDMRGDQQPEPSGTGERLLRKVGRNRKISVYGKLYGPLPQELVGQQVEIEDRDDRLIVWNGTTDIGSFERQA